MQQLKSQISEFDRFLARKEEETDKKIFNINTALQAFEKESLRKSDDIKEYKTLLRQTQAENEKISRQFEEKSIKLEELKQNLEELQESREQQRIDLEQKITILVVENHTLTSLLENAKKESQVNQDTFHRFKEADEKVRELSSENDFLKKSLKSTKESLERAQHVAYLSESACQKLTQEVD